MPPDPPPPRFIRPPDPPGPVALRPELHRPGGRPIDTAIGRVARHQLARLAGQADAALGHLVRDLAEALATGPGDPIPDPPTTRAERLAAQIRAEAEIPIIPQGMVLRCDSQSPQRRKA